MMLQVTGVCVVYLKCKSLELCVALGNLGYVLL